MVRCARVSAEHPRIETDRLVLRRWREEDLAPFAAMNADPVVMEYLPALLDRAESDAFAARCDAALAADGYGLFAVEVKGGPAFVGYVGVRSLAGDDTLPFAAEGEVGWRLAHGAWGRGYAPEGALASMAECFTVHGFTEIVSFTSVGNTRSQSVMRKIGMHRDPADDFDHPRVAPGHRLRPHVLYRLRAAEFTARPVPTR